MTFEEYKNAVENGKCPICDSDNTRKYSSVSKITWGCLDCDYGHWEKLLDSESRIKYIQDNPECSQYMRIYAEYDKKYRKGEKKIKSVKNKDGTKTYRDGSTQLKLF